MNEAVIWQKYVDNNLEKFIKSLKSEDFINNRFFEIDIKEIDISTSKSAYKSLRRYLNEDSIKRLQNRFRAHKHREKVGIKNIQIKENSLNMLKRFKKQVGADTLEEALDFLLSPDYSEYSHDVAEAKIKIGEEGFEGRDIMLSSFMSRLTNYDRERVALLIEYAFSSGWNDASVQKREPETLKQKRWKH